MKLRIDSEVNPWPYGHKKLTQVNVLPHDPNKPFTYNNKKYQFWPNNNGTIYEISLMFIDYDVPKETEAGLAPLKTEKYLWYMNTPIDMSLPKQNRYNKVIQEIQKSCYDLYNDHDLGFFIDLMKEKTNFAITCCDLLP